MVNASEGRPPLLIKTMLSRVPITKKQQIADRYRCSANTARRWATAWFSNGGERPRPFVDIACHGDRPWDWDIRLTQIPDEWDQVAV